MLLICSEANGELGRDGLRRKVEVRLLIMSSADVSVERRAASSWLAILREGGLVAWALREWKRDVRESDAVGVFLLRSSVLSNKDEISLSTVPCDGGVVEGNSRDGEGGSSFAAAADRWRRGCWVVKERDGRHWLRCVLPCRAMDDAALLGWAERYPVGARNSSSGCDERSSASPQRSDSMGKGIDVVRRCLVLHLPQREAFAARRRSRSRADDMNSNNLLGYSMAFTTNSRT